VFAPTCTKLTPPFQKCACSQTTRRNLARVNEDAIDFELLEELIIFIDDSLGEESGAILVFLPGACLNIFMDTS